MGDLELLPEAINWRDEGCRLFPRCLDCPLPRCIEEEPKRKPHLATVVRDREMAELRQRGKSPGEIARIFGVSVRTVSRALRRHRDRND